MSLHQRERDLIDHYLNGELSGIELDNFRNRMQSDPQFEKLVHVHSIVRKGIVLSKEEDLKKLIIGKINYRKPLVPFALKLIVTFLVITAMGITVWFYLGTDSSTPDNRFSLLTFLSKENEKKVNKKSVDIKNKGIQKEEKASATSGGQVEEKSDSKSNLSAETSEQTSEPETRMDSTVQVSDEDRDIVIKKDKLLINATLFVIEKTPSDGKISDLQSENTNLSQEAIQKLNPESGVPEEEKNFNSMVVEFWVSPVNYKGYKMSKNKIILFGIEEPDAVKIYRSSDVLYMKYGNDFFRLVNTFDFLPYQRLKEAEVPLAIRQ